MAHTSLTWPAVPVVDGWLAHARTGLAQLSQCATLDDVRARFSTARRLTEHLLGFPCNGGHATKPMVRLVGELLHHALGPAVAVEALAFAVEIQGLVPTEAIIEILQRYLKVGSLLPSPTPIELEAIVDTIGRETGRRRSATAIHLCRPRQRRERVVLEDRSSFHVPGWTSGCSYLFEELMQLIGRLKAEPPADDRLDRDGGDDLVEALWERTDWALRRPGCPDGLLDRIRHPYDEASLHLAIRAGGEWYTAGRVRRLLQAATDECLGRIAEQSSAALLRALVELDLLSDVRLCQAVGETTVEQWRRTVVALGEPSVVMPLLAARLIDGHTPLRFVAAVLLEAPTATRADQFPTAVLPDEVIVALARHPMAEVRCAAAAHVRPGMLDAEIVDRLLDDVQGASSEMARRLGRDGTLPALVAAAVVRCHSSGRPLIPWEVAAEPFDVAPLLPAQLLRSCPEWAALVGGVAAIDLGQVHRKPRRFSTVPLRPYRYPRVLGRLDGTGLPGHVEWTVGLPRDEEDLRRNADEMDNCTASYGASIERGKLFILIVDGPAGRCCNVAVRFEGGVPVIGATASRSNRAAPSWMAEAVRGALLETRRPRLPDVQLPAEPPIRRRALARRRG